MNYKFLAVATFWTLIIVVPVVYSQVEKASSPAPELPHHFRDKLPKNAVLIEDLGNDWYVIGVRAKQYLYRPYTSYHGRGEMMIPY